MNPEIHLTSKEASLILGVFDCHGCLDNSKHATEEEKETIKEKLRKIAQ